MKKDCGCNIKQGGSYAVPLEIVYCPLHETAPRLLAAVKSALSYLVTGDYPANEASLIGALKTIVKKADPESQKPCKEENHERTKARRL